jgi:hypothetical protein
MSGPRRIAAALLGGVLCLSALPVRWAQPAPAGTSPLSAEPAASAATAATAALAASAGRDPASERTALADERRRLEAGFDADEAACAGRFFVNACIDEVRQRRRAALVSIDARERALEDAVRRERAEHRRRMTQQRQQAAAAPASAGSAASAPREEVVPATAVPDPKAGSGAQASKPPLAAGVARDVPAQPASAPVMSRRSPASAGAPRPPRPPADPAKRAAEAAARAAAAEQRREEARATQERIERRQGERAASGKVVQPLPVPASAAGR